MAIVHLDPITLKCMYDRDEIILIDVRNAEEHQAIHIQRDMHIPLESVSKETIPEFGDKRLAFYCRTGHASRTACEIASELYPGFNVFNLLAGIIGWSVHHFPVVLNGVNRTDPIPQPAEFDDD
ncbi:MAG: rhodanese-like domain-containing protein [Pseudomonadota bacterium]